MKTIKIIMVVLASVLFANLAQAQAQFSLGIKAGANFSSINVSDPAATWDGKTGFHGGAFALIKITAFAIQPELIFSQQGSKVKINGQDLDANFSYLNVPIIAKFYLPMGLNFQLGPQFGFLTTAESDYNPITNTPQNGTDLEDFYKNSDVSLGMGIGWDLPLRLSIDARYNLGLTQIEDDASIEATKNQVFQISVGYKLIKLGK
jgi:hypothetical protein